MPAAIVWFSYAGDSEKLFYSVFAAAQHFKSPEDILYVYEEYENPVINPWRKKITGLGAVFRQRSGCGSLNGTKKDIDGICNIYFELANEHQIICKIDSDVLLAGNTVREHGNNTEFIGIPGRKGGACYGAFYMFHISKLPAAYAYFKKIRPDRYVKWEEDVVITPPMMNGSFQLLTRDDYSFIVKPENYRAKDINVFFYKDTLHHMRQILPLICGK